MKMRGFAVGVDAACVLLSVAATLLTIRAVRRQRELEQAHARALVDRANELDMFAKRVAHDLLNPLSALSFTLLLLPGLLTTAPAQERRVPPSASELQLSFAPVVRKAAQTSESSSEHAEFARQAGAEGGRSNDHHSADDGGDQAIFQCRHRALVGL